MGGRQPRADSGSRTTLADVARLSGVSVSTASRALSGAQRISAETRSAVLRAVTELNYRPNRAAQALRTQHSQLVGLVMTNLVNASFHAMTEVIQQRLAENDYQSVLCLTGGDVEQEEARVAMLVEHHVDGVIMMGSDGVVPPPASRHLTEIPAVNLIRRETTTSVDTVLAADEEGAYLATRHLLELGHERIGLIVGLPDHPAGNDRRAGYLRALASAGIAPDPALVGEGRYAPPFGAEAARSMLVGASRPTALLLANHEAAFGALPVLNELDLQIPDDLSVICFEDAPAFTFWRPPLTVVDFDPEGLASLAVDLLLKRIRARGHDQAVGRQYRLGAQLLERESTSPPPSSSTPS